MRQVPLGVYVNRQSPIHRIPALLKFGLLFIFVLSGALLSRTPQYALIFIALAGLGYLIARIPPTIAFNQLWPPLPLLIFLGAYLWWQSGWQLAAATIGSIYSAIMAATLLTLTTTQTQMLEAVDRILAPLGKLGLPVDTISLAISMTLRLIPLQLATVHEVLDARKARGAGFSIVAFGVPVLVRSLRRATMLSDALVARGVGDDKP